MDVSQTVEDTQPDYTGVRNKLLTILLQCTRAEDMNIVKLLFTMKINKLPK
jgi:hypothetical protein